MNGASETTAWLCPGQGSPPRDLAAYLINDPFCAEIAPFISELMDADFQRIVCSGDDTLLRRNEISAMLSVVAAISAARALNRSGTQPSFRSGYSVGLWPAMHLAGMLDLDSMLKAVWTRALFMNDTDGAKRGAMLAVIGLSEKIVAEACAAVTSLEDPIQIANFNCPGQYTLAGSRIAVEAVKPLLSAAKAHKFVDVQVQGAWHSPLMAAAVAPFREYLSGVEFLLPNVPVLGNQTGEPLPADPEALRDDLANHIAQPVQWQKVMQYLLGGHVTECIEVGFGNTLSKFGLYTNRSISHVTWMQVIKAAT